MITIAEAIKYLRNSEDAFGHFTEIAELLESMQWQPIETAPHLEDVIIIHPKYSPVVAYHGDGSIKHPYYWIDNSTRIECFFEPTHWMPPPQTENR